jgi:hypothetical protein
MRNCNTLEKLERMISTLAREARAVARERKAASRAARMNGNGAWPPTGAQDDRGVPGSIPDLGM